MLTVCMVEFVITCIRPIQLCGVAELLSSPSYRWRNWTAKGFSYSPKTTRVMGRATRRESSWLLNHHCASVSSCMMWWGKNINEHCSWTVLECWFKCCHTNLEKLIRNVWWNALKQMFEGFLAPRLLCIFHLMALSLVDVICARLVIFILVYFSIHLTYVAHSLSLPLSFLSPLSVPFLFSNTVLSAFMSSLPQLPHMIKMTHRLDVALGPIVLSTLQSAPFSSVSALLYM